MPEPLAESLVPAYTSPPAPQLPTGLPPHHSAPLQKDLDPAPEEGGGREHVSSSLRSGMGAQDKSSSWLFFLPKPFAKDLMTVNK